MPGKSHGQWSLAGYSLPGGLHGGLKRARHDLVTKQQRKCRKELNRAKKKNTLTEIKDAQEEVSSKLDDTKKQINELKEYWKSPKLKSKKNF